MCLDNKIKAWNKIKENLKNKISEYVYRETRRKPVILPILMEVDKIKK